MSHREDKNTLRDCAFRNNTRIFLHRVLHNCYSITEMNGNESHANFDHSTRKVTTMDWTNFESSTGLSTKPSIIVLHHRATVASILIGLAMIGLFGNALVIISVLVVKKLRTITNILVVNLALADFMTCSCFPFQVVGLLSQTGSYPLHEVVCATVAGVINTSVCCSAWTLVVIAFIRWYVITRSIRGHQGIHTPKKIATVVAIIWIASVVFMVVPPVQGIGTLGYSPYYGVCSLTDTNPKKVYYVLFQGTLIAVVLLLTLVFYILILHHVLLHNRRIRDNFTTADDTSSSAAQNHQNNSLSLSRDSRPPMIKAIDHKEIKITKNLFMVVCASMLCFLGTGINFTIPGSSVPTLYVTTILLTNSVINPIIYGLKHPNFQEVFKKLLSGAAQRLFQWGYSVRNQSEDSTGALTS